MKQGRRASRAPARLGITRILAPTDFSPGADVALRWANILGQAFKAKVIVLHVLDLNLATVAGLPPQMAMMPAVDQLAERLRAETDEMMSDLATRYPDARTLIREGSPRPVILEVAEQEDVDLIVMGTHGRTGLAHVLFGSVAEHVVRHSRVPVLTVRQEDLT